MKLRVILTGATGMVGEGVLLECLQHPDVERVLLLSRRPSGYLHPTPGQRRVLPLYRYLRWLYPVARRLAPGVVSTMREVGQAMIAAALRDYPRPVLEVRDLVALAHGRVHYPA